MAIDPTLLKPGLLVSLKTNIRGAVTYRKRNLEADRQLEGPSTIRLVETWQTTRTVADIDEYNRAVIARGKARAAIVRCCSATSFGLLCPVANQAKLDEAVAEARAIVDAHNKTARFARLELYVICGRVADNDEQAAAAIASEVRTLIAEMEGAVKNADPEAIRSAANRARSVAGMLSPATAAKVSAAIAEVRAIATDIVKRVERAGETAAKVLDGVKLDKLTAARFAVLDVADDGEILQPEIAAPAIDLRPREPKAQPEPSAPAIDPAGSKTPATPAAQPVDVEY